MQLNKQRKIPEAEIREWLDLPVTQRYFESLEATKQEIEQTPFPAYFAPGEPDVTQERMAKRLGWLEVIASLLAPEAAFSMVNANVEEDEDE